MIVVIVLSIIAGIVTIAYNTQLERARDQHSRQALVSISKGLDNYYQSNGSYPITCGQPHSSSCDSANDYGAVALELITATSTSSDINNLMPEISKDLSHPRSNSNRPINQSSSNRTNADSYYIFTTDSHMWRYHVGLTNIRILFNNPDGSVLDCRYSLREYNPENNTARRPYPYVLGYYSEAEKSWKFYRSDNRNDQNILIWNSTGVAACAADSIGSLSAKIN